MSFYKYVIGVPHRHRAEIINDELFGELSQVDLSSENPDYKDLSGVYFITSPDEEEALLKKANANKLHHQSFEVAILIENRREELVEGY